MPCSTSPEPPSGTSQDQQVHLSALLSAKLQGIPLFHIPSLTLSNVFCPTARALHIPHIPPDIQLPFFLRNRNVIDQYGGKPVKDEAKQGMDITRAIWFWRLDEARQFQRFHDTMRWNTAMFIALLALDLQTKSLEMSQDTTRRGHHDTTAPQSKKVHINTAAYRFMKQYLAAVLEHHNTPLLFDARETFIVTWKNGALDLYTGFRGAQKKLLKNLMKKLTKDWEKELDIAESNLGKEEYRIKVAKFAGSLVPRRREQDIPTGTRPMQEKSGRVYGTDSPPCIPHKSQEIKKNDLLDALRVPFTPQTKEKTRDQKNGSYELKEDVNMVTELRNAIEALQVMRPQDMLPVLMHLFPASEMEQADT
ncbi:hypothetical protein COCMIDRAFT_30463 [Bipolaris oryzae ATCC 44560]|uniref:Uncharacterized protein n=1 Tax=Bipolaris oryzae ATCC 44560 TaxID=930090 RepID=W6YSV5_COCMI|nr:uncharacterized protein COCMIDRAFT_30463 [Bipolaris oryzae ATCC 44560]EUC40623.1 hypothetical protein COCMIDRAFT_30463 [Bipolaris oryzae ATCC 44560]